MAIDQARFVLLLVAFALGAASEDSIGLGIGVQNLPDLFFLHGCVVMRLEDATKHSSDGHLRGSANNVAIVAPVLGESLLDERAPQRRVVAHAREHSAFLAVRVDVNWQVVVNDDSVRDSESEEVEAVDAGLVQIVFLLQEDLLHAAWLLSNSRDGCEEPAVAKATLVDIIGADAIAKQSPAREDVLSAGPLKID